MDRGAREHRGPWEDLDRTPRRQRLMRLRAQQWTRPPRQQQPNNNRSQPRSHPPTFFRRHRQPSSKTERRAAISLQILPGRSLTTGHRQQQHKTTTTFGRSQPPATASTNSTESTFRNALVPGKMLNSKGSVVWPKFKSRVMKSHPQRYYARGRSTTTPEYAPARTTEPTFVDALTHGNNTHTPRVLKGPDFSRVW